MDASALSSLLPELDEYLVQFADCFSHSGTRRHLKPYVVGQLSDLARKSVEPMALLSQVPVRTLQEFLSLHDWDDAKMRDRCQQLVAMRLSDQPTIGLFDDTSSPKRGTKTPGVQRQWCGHLGKVDNCVVTVHLGVTSGNFRAVLDGDLFLPEEWNDDRKRCQAAGIPDEVTYRPKWEIALEQYDRAVKNGMRFDWLTFDEGYGQMPAFLKALSERKQRWVAEVPKSTMGWLVAPQVIPRTANKAEKAAGYEVTLGSHPDVAPSPDSNPVRRRARVRLTADTPPMQRLDQLLEQPPLSNQPWERYQMTDRQKGPSVWEVKHALFYPSSGDLKKPVHVLFCRHVLSRGDVKYQLSNAPEETPVTSLLHAGLTRYPVEQIFREEQSQLGLDHYEGRTYGGLMRHRRLTCVSYLFLMQAMLARRGEKSGVDGAPSASGDQLSTLRQVAPRNRFLHLAQTNRHHCELPAKSQRRRPRLAHQTYHP
jgi:SRSO17 transposase